MHICSELHFIPMADVIHELVNGQQRNDLSTQDRGLSYGHGVFETVKVVAGEPILIDEHLQRLISSCQRLKIPTDNLLQQLIADLDYLPYVDLGVVKIIVTAGVGGRGYQLPDDPRPSRIVQLFPFPHFPDNPSQQGIQARWCDIQLSSVPTLAGIKHLNRLEQVLARAEWSDPHIREGILLGSDQFIAEGTMSNIFIVKDNTLKTPDLSRYGVEGIMRNHIIKLAKQSDLSVSVLPLTKNDLLDADEVFFCNSLIEIWPLRKIAQQSFEVGAVTRSLQKALMAESYHRC